MTNGKNGRKKSTKELKILTVIIVAILILTNLIFEEDEPKNEEQSKNAEQVVMVDKPIDTIKRDGELILTMIDVGQADCFLLMQNGETALVDCGTRSTGKDAVEYLKSIGITKLDYVFGTHPHDDHMGGMYDIITNLEVDKIIIPKVEEELTSNWYMKLMEELSSGEYTIVNPKVGDIYSLGDATIKVIGQMFETNGNTNNYSTVMKVSFGEMDIIMTGDAETEVEDKILASKENIDAEILKMGHHGSDTSTSTEFLDAISPDYALISSKVGNKYEHPIKSTMEKLEEREIEVYRTDENGTVIAIITSENVSFNCEPGDYLSGVELEDQKENIQ